MISILELPTILASAALSFNSRLMKTFGTHQRSDDWAIPGNNPQVRDNWKQVSQERLFARVDAHDKTVGALEKLGRKAAGIGTVAVAALIVLI